MANAIAQLKADHVRMKGIFERMLATTERGAATREALLRELERESKIHAQVEEEVFYPAFKEAAEARPDRHIFFKATESHHAFDVVLVELMGTDAAGEEFLAKTELLRDVTLNHMREEEREMFTRARVLLSADELADVGDRMDERRASLVAQWDNALLRPLKKVQGVVQAMLPSSVKNAKATALQKTASRGRSGNGRRRVSAGRPLRRA